MQNHALAGGGIAVRWLRACVIALTAALAIPCEGGVVRQITNQKSTQIASYGLSDEYAAAVPCLDDAGTTVFVNASTNKLGGNPGHLFQIFSFDAASGAGQQITHLPKGVSDQPGTVSVSDDGQWLAFVSRSDPVGQNHDASPEVFVMHPDGSGLAQRTSDPAVNAGVVRAAALSGSANRIVFLSNSNPLGTNASNRVQLFVVNFDGTGLRQLTTLTTSPTWYGFSISDDGARIVFATTANLTGGNADGSPEVFAIQADGTNLRQLTSATSRDLAHPKISGDGTKVTFWAESSFKEEVFVINWDGTGLLKLTTSSSGRDAQNPSITDDGQFVYFTTSQGSASAHYEIWKIKTDGTGLTQLTATPAQFSLAKPLVAGGGGRVAFSRKQAADVYGEAGELDVMTSTGTNVQNLDVTSVFLMETPAITRDGTRTVFVSDMNPFGTNPDGGEEIFRIQADGSGLAQVTSLAAGDAYDPSIAADGTTIVFESRADPFGQNSDGTYEIFLIHADGTGLRQLTSSSFNSYYPVISANGTVVAFTSDMIAGSYSQIYTVKPDGTGLTMLTYGNGASSYLTRIDDAGTWVAFVSYANLDGQNPNQQFSQIYRVRSDGTGLQRISTDVTHYEHYPDISGTGTRIVYISDADPVGTNPSHAVQIFCFDTTTSTTRQLTTLSTGNVIPPSISGDGNYVYFGSSRPFDEFNPNFYWDLYRVPATGGSPERLGALSPSMNPISYPPRTDMTGSRIVLDGYGDTSEENPDNSNEIWMVDLTQAPQIRVGPGAPTLVSWDHEAGALRYDVLRGDVDNLAPGPSSTVNLGPVVCLENDSPDADTRGFEDAAQPAPGHAFFFLFRGSRGMNYGPGSWGQDSAGRERVPASGACAP